MNTTYMMSYFKPAIAVISMLFFLAGVVAPPPPAAALTVQEEREMAEEFLDTVFEYYDVIEDPMINDYIRDLGKKLTHSVPPQALDFHFYVIREDKFNAFAGPGGHIFVFSGLIEAMENENELAAILTHEMAHVSARHISDMIEKSKKTSMTTLAGVIAGILIGLGGASAAGSALTIGSMAAGQTMTLAYSRENEMQADQIGRKYLTGAGYDLHGLLSVLKKIRAREWFGEKQIPTYMKTHPATTDRLIRIDNTLDDDRQHDVKNSYAFERTRARIKALYGTGSDSLNQLEQMAENAPESPAAQYGYGLGLAERGQPEDAISHLQTASELRPDDAYIAIALGRAHFLAGHYDKAAEILNHIRNLKQYGPDGILHLGRVEMARGHFHAAAAIFADLLAAYPEHENAFYFLGQSFGEMEQLGNAHYYLGRYYRSQNDWSNARFHFKRALQHTDSAEQKSRIQKKLDSLKNPQRPRREKNPGLSPPGF
ncbi:MAG: M48 family metalloprotease [Thermodesulfobacteriota bacterium]